VIDLLRVFSCLSLSTHVLTHAAKKSGVVQGCTLADQVIPAGG